MHSNGSQSGWYFDMTKLTYLKNKGVIDKAVIVLPSKELESFARHLYCYI